MIEFELNSNLLEHKKYNRLVHKIRTDSFKKGYDKLKLIHNDA